MKPASHYKEIRNKKIEELVNAELLLIENKIEEMSEKGIKSFLYQWSGKNTYLTSIQEDIESNCIKILQKHGYNCHVYNCYYLQISLY